jgi:hypothetical protein
MPVDEDSLWDDFHEWADANGVGLDDEAVWGPWWACFLAGARAQAGG